jgi:AraC-like DNA-binding protein
MPLLSELPSSVGLEHLDVVPRPVVTLGAAGVDAERFDLRETDFHQHSKGELVLTLRGVVTCEVAGGLWVVPPQGALWIPAGVVHKAKAAGMIECYVTLVDPDVATRLPMVCCALATTPLLRELVIRSASLPLLYPEGGMESRLVSLLLDEAALAPMGELHLPMPADTRLRGIVARLMEDPSDRSTIACWARRFAMSERTLARRLAQQTGMSFGRWRQQLQLMLAVQWLGSGSSVQQVADRLGYESAGSFVTMFKKALGTSPGRYITERFGPNA